jgi:AsmA-like C-terminal region/AsmA family
VSNAVSETIVSVPPPGSPSERRARPWRWLKWIALAIVCLWLADAGVSLLLQHTTMKRHLTAHLEAVFGRPVEVGSYAFSLWTGPELEARGIRVAEDPRFGQEYFLRADSLTVRLRWWGLLFGHLELGTVSLSHPSLNLVRAANGDWNLAEWLPRPANDLTAAERSETHSTMKPAVHFRKIEVDAGRINFKREDEKLPFAFVDVDGTLETESPGRWRLDLVAVPARAAVIVQDPGVLHLVGHLGGTSSRLRPASLEIDWNDASIPDVLRLAAGRDYGLRGTLGVSVTARTQGDSWLLKGNASLGQMHRWDLPLRSDNPSLSVVADGRLDASGSRLELASAKIETPRSNATVTGALDWTHPGPALADLLSLTPSTKSGRRSQSPKTIPLVGTRLRVVSKEISLADLLDWARAFHPGIADGVTLDGLAGFDASLNGWPPRVDDAAFDFPRGSMAARGMPASVRLASVLVRYEANRGITLAPATITIGAPSSSFRLEGSAKPRGNGFSLRLRGGTSEVHDVIAAASELGWNLARGWTLAGPAHCDLRWQGTAEPWHTTLAGSVDWGTASDGVSLAAPFLNRPVEQIRARAELTPSLTRVTLSSARALGARWTGTLNHDLSDGWKFSVSGDSLSAADLDRWLDPRWRESFLDRMLPFLNSGTSASDALASLRASGRIALDDFSLAPVAVHHFQGDVALDGNHLEVTNITGQFYRGELAGSLQASLDSTPKYEAALGFSGVDLATLSAEFPSLAGRFSGSASARIRFSMQGASRSDLTTSLECRGTAVAKGFSAEKISLEETSSDQTSPQSDLGGTTSGTTTFPNTSAEFSCASGKLQLQDLVLSEGVDARWEGAGSVDFSRNIDLRLRPANAEPSQPRPARLTGGAKVGEYPDATGTGYSITGTLESPRVSRVSTPARASRENP